MNKKIICILISGIFLVAIFPSLNTSCKANCLSGLSETKDTLFKNKVELVPSPIQGDIGFKIAFGDFYVENNSVKGHAIFYFGLLLPIPVPVFGFDTDVDIPLYDLNATVYICKYTNQQVFWFWMYLSEGT